MRLGWKLLERDKHSSLWDLIVNYNCKKFYLIGPIIDELMLLEVLKGSEVFTKSYNKHNE
jgi:hypothetical protein